MVHSEVSYVYRWVNMLVSNHMTAWYYFGPRGEGMVRINEGSETLILTSLPSPATPLYHPSFEHLRSRLDLLHLARSSSRFLNYCEFCSTLQDRMQIQRVIVSAKGEIQDVPLCKLTNAPKSCWSCTSVLCWMLYWLYWEHDSILQQVMLHLLYLC